MRSLFLARALLLQGALQVIGEFVIPSEARNPCSLTEAVVRVGMLRCAQHDTSRGRSAANYSRKSPPGNRLRHRRTQHAQVGHQLRPVMDLVLVDSKQDDMHLAPKAQRL